ncbi:MAG: translation initiation factor IF-2 [Sphingomonadales bacterium]|nr:translation initiation factor IF-2 [Sphingomonadales bacterium]
MSDGRKLTTGNRGPQGGATGADGGSKVRQSFSHGRSKPVVVERKRKKLRMPGQAPAPAVEVKQPQAPVIQKEKPQEDGNLSSREKDVRAEALKDAIRTAESERMKASESKRIREKDEAKEKEKQAHLDIERKAKEEAEAKKTAEVEAKTLAAEAEIKASEAAAKLAQEEDKGSGFDARKAEEEAHKKKKQVADKKKHVSRPRGGDRRRSGKLTVNRALRGGDDIRPRSLAAMKRAQAKKKLYESGEKPKRTLDVIVPEIISVQELANRMAERATDVIKVLMNMDVIVTLNETVDQDTAELVVQEFGHNIRRVSESDVEIGLMGEEDDESNLVARPPVITVMGHVDHGKTSLLDALRTTDIVAGEAGGITQHIGAYQIERKDGNKLTFLDTPGHEAFSEMRARGAGVTDIVILVVAADDGIKPQTIEAIHHAKAAEVPIIIAINKMDKDGADPDRVRQELLQHEIIVEKMSGDVLDVEISALKRQGLDKLEEAIELQTEILELKANPNRSADGVVVEAKLDKGRGPVTTVLVQRGTLKIGDIIVAGTQWGKVRAIVDDHGKKIKTALPSQPVEVLGMSGTPSAGNSFAVVQTEARAREVIEYRLERLKKEKNFTGDVSLEDMFNKMLEAKAEEVPLVIKADVQGTLEAITQAINKLGNDEIKARILHGGVGGITESDVSLASASKAPIIGFNVKINSAAQRSARADGVVIEYYSVIYDLVDSVKAAMEGRLAPAFDETIVGTVEVKEVFSAGKTGKAAGCIVVDGVARASAQARLLRGEDVIYEGDVSSLRRFKDEVKEVQSGTECGVTFDSCSDVKAGDKIEFFELKERKRTLSDT